MIRFRSRTTALLLVALAAPAQSDRAPAFAVTTDSSRHIAPVAFGGNLLIIEFLGNGLRAVRAGIAVAQRVCGQIPVRGGGCPGNQWRRGRSRYRDFLRGHPVALETYRDPERRISRSFGTTMFPETYLIQNKRIVRKVVGAIDWMGDEIASFVRARRR